MISTLSMFAYPRACLMVIHPEGDICTPAFTAWWRHNFTRDYERVNRRSGRTAPVWQSRKADCDRERLVLVDRSRPPRERALPRDAERPRYPLLRGSREPGRPRSASRLLPLIGPAQGVAATGPGLNFALGRPCPGTLLEGGGAFDVAPAAAAAFPAGDAIAA